MDTSTHLEESWVKTLKTLMRVSPKDKVGEEIDVNILNKLHKKWEEHKYKIVPIPMNDIEKVATLLLGQRPSDNLLRYYKSKLDSMGLLENVLLSPEEIEQNKRIQRSAVKILLMSTTYSAAFTAGVLPAYLVACWHIAIGTFFVGLMYLTPTIYRSVKSLAVRQWSWMRSWFSKHRKGEQNMQRLRSADKKVQIFHPIEYSDTLNGMFNDNVVGHIPVGTTLMIVDFFNSSRKVIQGVGGVRVCHVIVFDTEGSNTFDSSGSEKVHDTEENGRKGSYYSVFVRSADLLKGLRLTESLVESSMDIFDYNLLPYLPPKSMTDFKEQKKAYKVAIQELERIKSVRSGEVNRKYGVRFTGSVSKDKEKAYRADMKKIYTDVNTAYAKLRSYFGLKKDTDGYFMGKQARFESVEYSPLHETVLLIENTLLLERLLLDEGFWEKLKKFKGKAADVLKDKITKLKNKLVAAAKKEFKKQVKKYGDKKHVRQATRVHIKQKKYAEKMLRKARATEQEWSDFTQEWQKKEKQLRQRLKGKKPGVEVDKIVNRTKERMTKSFVDRMADKLDNFWNDAGAYMGDTSLPQGKLQTSRERDLSRQGRYNESVETFCPIESLLESIKDSVLNTVQDTSDIGELVVRYLISQIGVSRTLKEELTVVLNKKEVQLSKGTQIKVTEILRHGSDQPVNPMDRDFHPYFSRNKNMSMSPMFARFLVHVESGKNTGEDVIAFAPFLMDAAFKDKWGDVKQGFKKLQRQEDAKQKRLDKISSGHAVNWLTFVEQYFSNAQVKLYKNYTDEEKDLASKRKEAAKTLKSFAKGMEDLKSQYEEFVLEDNPSYEHTFMLQLADPTGKQKSIRMKFPKTKRDNIAHLTSQVIYNLNSYAAVMDREVRKDGVIPRPVMESFYYLVAPIIYPFIDDMSSGALNESVTKKEWDAIAKTIKDVAGERDLTPEDFTQEELRNVRLEQFSREDMIKFITLVWKYGKIKPQEQRKTVKFLEKMKAYLKKMTDNFTPRALKGLRWDKIFVSLMIPVVAMAPMVAGVAKTDIDGKDKVKDMLVDIDTIVLGNDNTSIKALERALHSFVYKIHNETYKSSSNDLRTRSHTYEMAQKLKPIAKALGDRLKKASTKKELSWAINDFMAKVITDTSKFRLSSDGKYEVSDKDIVAAKKLVSQVLHYHDSFNNMMSTLNNEVASEDIEFIKGELKSISDHISKTAKPISMDKPEIVFHEELKINCTSLKAALSHISGEDIANMQVYFRSIHTDVKSHAVFEYFIKKHKKEFKNEKFMRAMEMSNYFYRTIVTDKYLQPKYIYSTFKPFIENSDNAITKGINENPEYWDSKYKDAVALQKRLLEFNPLPNFKLKDAQEKVADTLWFQRSPDSLITSPEEAVNVNFFFRHVTQLYNMYTIFYE